MEFYKKLSNYYDILHVKDENILNFLSSNLPKSANILDASCKTGEYAISLYEKGFNITGIDIDSYMIDKARDNRGILPIKFYKYDMRDISSKFSENEFDEIFSLNNSLSYLMDKEEIYNTLKSMYSSLKVNGKIVIELCNYDNLLSEEPIIYDTSKAKLSMQYINSNEPNKIILKQILSNTNKYMEKEECIMEVPLINISVDEIITFLKDANFINIETLNNYNDSNNNIILVAYKPDTLLSSSDEYEDYDVNIVKSQSCCKNSNGCCKK